MSMKHFKPVTGRARRCDWCRDEGNNQTDDDMWLCDACYAEHSSDPYYRTETITKESS